MFAAALDVGRDARLVQALAQHQPSIIHDLLVPRLPHRHLFSQFGVFQRIEIIHRKVFEQHAHPGHAQPVGQWRVNVHRRLRDRLLAVRRQVLQRLHVVQPVAELDQHHAHVARHGQDHLAQVADLVFLVVRKMQRGDFGDPVHQFGHGF